MANNILAVDLVASKSLQIFTNELYFVKNMNRDYEKTFNLDVEDHRTGPSIRIRKPAKRKPRSGTWTRSAQDFTEQYVTLTVDTPYGDDMDIPESELTFLVNNPDAINGSFSDRFLKPRMTALANLVDADQFARMYVSVPNLVGSPGQELNSWGVYGNAMQKLDENLCPATDRKVIINPSAKNKSSDAFKGLFVERVADKAFSQAYLQTVAGLDVYSSANVPNHQVGPLGGTPLVNGGSQVGSSLVTDGWTASAALRLRKGDIFTIAGVYQVNAATQVQYPALQQFVVTSNASSDGSGNATVGIYPGIVTSGAFQTVSGSPADNAAITVVGTASALYAQNLAFYKDAFSIAFAKLTSPQDGVMSATKVFENISMRYMRDYDIDNARRRDRIDVFCGSVPLYPEWACRMIGN